MGTSWNADLLILCYPRKIKIHHTTGQSDLKSLEPLLQFLNARHDIIMTIHRLLKKMRVVTSQIWCFYFKVCWMLYMLKTNGEKNNLLLNPFNLLHMQRWSTSEHGCLSWWKLCKVFSRQQQIRIIKIYDYCLRCTIQWKREKPIKMSI